MSTWRRGSQRGYTLTVSCECTEYPDLTAALVAYDDMAAAARKANAPAAAPS